MTTMKKLLLLSLILTVFVSTAQKRGKIKGNREVLIKKFDLPAFTALEAGENFKIGIQKATDTTRVVIETDDNLFDVIRFKVEEGILKLYTLMDIVKKKRLRVTVYIPNDFQKIKVIDKAKVFNDETLDFETLSIETSNRGKVDLNLNIKKSINITGRDKSELQLNLSGKKAKIYLTDNAILNGNFGLSEANIEAEKHAEINLEGSLKELQLKLKDKAKFDSEKLVIEKADLKAFDKAVINIKVTNTIEMSLFGETETYLFDRPKIILKAFDDHAALFKK